MRKIMRLTPLFLAPALAAAFVAAPFAPTPVPGGIELAAAEVFIEFNSTDEDFGIQFFWDGVPWKRMRVEGPDGRRVLDVRARRNVARQGLTEGFFESAEPPVSQLTMQQFLQRFPPGDYEFEGTTLQGEELEGETEFTHVIPAPPTNLSPGSGVTVNASSPLVLTFDPVTSDLNGNPLVPELYEVVLASEGGAILRTLTIVLEGDVPNPSVTVPPEFLKPGEDYKFEVIVQEESHNRTISEIEFSTQ